jgi:dipeptidyl aminopeptidase/acylaminoacyl peptidase
MAEMKPIQYKARDGLTIHGYLTVPKGSSGKNLPLIVNPHGGPELRDNWVFDPEVQFLANRGYAVLRVNFRGSTGYGKSFVKAGFKEWGRKQQDDITDGVKWAIAQGIADPKRICIFGASYGGFAALTGLEQTPELYRCGISYAGVIDVQRNFKSIERNLKIVQAALADMLGEAKTDASYWKEISPINHVDKIQVPVFLAYSEYDPKIPIATARDLAKALKKRGKLYDFMVKDNEAHGFHQEVNRIEFYKKVDQFLKANLQ